jgi:Asp-tRNA(Asn)/Glu-tRNA(Gln) amidotransferase A subunit family amidase
MKRESEGGWLQSSSDASWYVTSTEAAVSQGLDGVSLTEHASVMDYHKAYATLHAVPSVVARMAVAKAREWENAGFPMFSSLNVTDILAQAYLSDARYERRHPLSVFDGVPIAFKDLMDINHHITNNGKKPSRKWDNANTAPDDILVARFRALGAIIFGASIMTEGGMSPLGYSAHYQGPFNAYSSGHFPGGSSSGAAAAVASGIVPVAIGFDSGGSVRLPAAWAGLHGLAPTFGRVPLDKELHMSMTKAGPIANSAIDAALAYSVIANKPTDNHHFYGLLYDGGSRGIPHAHLKGLYEIDDLSDIRIGVYPEWNSDATPAVRALTQQTIDLYVARGATLVTIDIPHMRWLSVAHGIKTSTEVALDWDLLHHTRRADLDANSRCVVIQI